MAESSFAIDEARNFAKKILERYQSVIKDGYVDVDFLAKQEGIDIIEEDFENGTLSGFLQIKTNSGQPVIAISKSDKLTRQRFTIAHELGHYFLHKSQSIHVDDLETAELILYRDTKSSHASHINEIQANQFAAELLMPSQMIKIDVENLRKQNKGMSDIVEKLAFQYKVSQSAMAIRLNKFI
jgi:Zn-dependent peptidase ImmA (M78 family)